MKPNDCILIWRHWWRNCPRITNILKRPSNFNFSAFRAVIYQNLLCRRFCIVVRSWKLLSVNFVKYRCISPLIALSDGKETFCVFESPWGRGSGATYAIHLRLTGKCIDSLAFCAKCYGWGAAREYRLKICVFFRNCSKSQVQRVARPPTILLVIKLGLSIFHNGINGQMFLSFYRSAHVWRTDAHTDRQTDRFRQQDRALCIRSRTAKMQRVETILMASC